jgi:hypothetical protein
MRNVLLILLCFLVLPVIAQDSTASQTPTMPDLTGLTAPQAHALLFEHGLVLDPLIVASSSGEGVENTIIDQSLAPGESYSIGAVISVTVLRQPNIRLVWNIEDHNNNSFTLVNLADYEINIEHLLFETADGSRRFQSALWPNFLRVEQCVQLWTYQEELGSRVGVDDCRILQGGGILPVLNEVQQFWRSEGSFYVVQEGLRRGECQIAAGICELWISPSAITEEFSPNVFLIYNQNQLIIHNRSSKQWLPLNQIAINDSAVLSDEREWDSLRFGQDMPFLAPNHCVRFGSASSPLTDCVEVAVRETTELFWRESFTVHSLRNSDISKTCPAALGDEATICLLLR